MRRRSRQVPAAALGVMVVGRYNDGFLPACACIEGAPTGEESPTIGNHCLDPVAVGDGESQVILSHARPGVWCFILGDLWKGKREQACGEVKGSCRRVDPGGGPPFPQAL